MLPLRVGHHLGTLLVVATLTAPARAQSEEQLAEAKRLFDEASAAMDRKAFDEACPKLEAVLKLTPGRIGGMMALAECYEGAGRTATAWAAYRDAATTAAAAGDARAVKAEARAATLGSRLSVLTITVGEAARALPGLEVRRNAIAVDAKSFGQPVVLDPGTLEISASAPGRYPFSTRVDLVAGLASRVEIASLDPIAPVSPVPPPPALATPPPPLPPPVQPDAPPPHEGGVPAWAWIAGAVGVAAGATAIGFAADQASSQSEFDETCKVADYDADACADLASRLDRDFALWIGFGSAGLVGLGVAGVGIATASSAPAAKVSLTSRGAVVTAEGAF